MRSIKILCAAALAASLSFGQQPGAALFDAVRQDDLSALKKQLAAGVPAGVRGLHGTTPLMLASAFGSLEAMRLLIDAGADVNAHNEFGSTALMWSVYDGNRVRLLLDHHADVDAATKAKETALLIASSGADSEAVVRLLLERGANAKVVDATGASPLFAAAGAGNLAVVRLFLDRGLDVNSADRTGSTPLMLAAGNADTAMAALLLQRGANVNAVSAKPGASMVKNGVIRLGSFTPLLLAATYGPAKLVKLLLDAGADVNARDGRGATPLILSVSSEFQDPEIVRLLLARGADPSVKMETGENARDWALKFGQPEVMGMVAPGQHAAALPVSLHEARNARSGAAAGIALMEKTSSSFFKTGGCVSCHAQNITALVVATARANGLPVDETAAAERDRTLRALWTGRVDSLLQRLDPAGDLDTTEYATIQFLEEGNPPSDVTSAMVHNLASQQRADGRWLQGGVARAPIQDGDAAHTALAVRALQAYGPPGRKAEFSERTERARKWLMGVQPNCIDERDFQLLGLKWSGAAQPVIQRLVRDLAAEQRPDGGWAQNPHLASDAYATGQALYTLHEAGGLSSDDPVYARGVQFLLRTQFEDGSWHVASRAVKFQPYFESGFPHGQDQWISQMATGWATVALSFAQPKPAIAGLAHN